MVHKDHNRNTLGYNSGNYSNDFETKTLDHDRDIEFFIDPMDVDETNQIVSIANIQARFEKRQAIPELDCYTFSKFYTEAKRVGAVIRTTPITTSNILAVNGGSNAVNRRVHSMDDLGDWYYFDPTADGELEAACWHERDNRTSAMEIWYVE